MTDWEPSAIDPIDLLVELERSFPTSWGTRLRFYSPRSLTVSSARPLPAWLLCSPRCRQSSRTI